MKKLSILSIAFLFALISYGQLGEGGISNFKSLKRKTLIVVTYEDGGIYNESVKRVAKERWYNEKIKYVNYNDIKAYKKRTDVVYLSLKSWYDYDGVPVICLTSRITGNYAYRFVDEKEGGWAYNYIQPHYGSESKFSTQAMMSGVQKLNKSTPERTDLLVHILFNTIDKFGERKYVLTNPAKEKATYNTPESIQTIKSKTLLVVESIIPRSKKNKKLLDVSYLKSLYKGKVKIVSESELAQAIKSKDKDALYFHYKEEGSFPVYSVIDLSERQVIYVGKYKGGGLNNMKLFELMMKQFSGKVF